MDPYRRLSDVYDLEWGQWSLRYVELLSTLLSRDGVSSARVLDLGCGTGALAVEMASLGHAVVGLDSSPSMIQLARRRAGAGAVFGVQDMSEASWEHDFDLVTCTFDAFNYLLTQTQVVRFFQSAARLLAPSGRLVFDSNTEKFYSAHHSGTRERLLGRRRVRHECRYDPATKLATTLFAFDDGEVETHVQRPYGLAELVGPMTAAGLVVAEAYSGLSAEPYHEGVERLVCVARKGR